MKVETKITTLQGDGITIVAERTTVVVDLPAKKTDPTAADAPDPRFSQGPDTGRSKAVQSNGKSLLSPQLLAQIFEETADLKLVSNTLQERPLSSHETERLIAILAAKLDWVPEARRLETASAVASVLMETASMSRLLGVPLLPGA